MNKSIKAVVYERHGNPPDVLRVETQPWPKAAAGEAVVQMRAAPINPADLNQIEGKYPVRFPLPATPGFEGAGLVVDLGTNVKDLAVGALVILPHNLGTWREAAAVKASELVTVPPGIDPVHAAMLKINPMTAWRLLHDYVDLKKGDWLIQNAANSAAGRAVIQIARELGYKTVNVVRRVELIDELRAEGGDIVFVDGEDLRENVKSATGDAPIRLGLNAVGGDSALRLANCLAPGSHPGDIRCHELAAAEDPERPAYFQRPAISWNLDQQMVRPRDDPSSEWMRFARFLKWQSAVC